MRDRGVGAVDGVEVGAESLGKAARGDMLHRADIGTSAFEDDAALLRQRFGDAIDGIFHEQVGDAARARLDRAVPRRGEAVGAGTLAQLIERRAAVADRLRRHADRAGRGEPGDEDPLFLGVDTGPGFAVTRDGGEGELFGQVVVEHGGGIGGERREDFLCHR